MNRILSLLIFLCSFLTLSAQEVATAITDKDCYMTGERLHVRIDVKDRTQSQALSKVAYVEISDAHRICAQGMVQLTDGTGWADIALPATMHSGNYQLSVYTRAMRNQPQENFFRKMISVVNMLRVVRADDIVYLPLDSMPQLYIARPTTVCQPGQELSIDIAPEYQHGTLTLMRKDLQTPTYDQLPELKAVNEKRSQNFTTEAEGHIVMARPTGTQPVELTRLVMVGRMASIYDGQWQADGTWHYYTHGLNGYLPTLLNSYDLEGKPVGMEFVSPFAKVLPQSLPKLHVYCNEEDLQRRSLSAQREQVVSNWQSLDSLALATDYLSSEPHHSYDLDEYTKFSTIREILIEFVKGVRRDKLGGVNQLFTIDPETHKFSRWPALVLLDGMPVYDIDEVLEYDARLLKYVQIYTDRYTFGNTMCQGIISFISQRGRLSNYKIDAGSHLVSYQFPQNRPDFIAPAENTAGTLYWNPCTIGTSIKLTVPAEAGTYELIRQHILPDGTVERMVEEIMVAN